MAHRARPKPATSPDPKPAQVVDVPWLFAERKAGDCPSHTERGGKWLLFAPVAQVDEVWAKIKQATEAGLLGSLAKVATAMPSPLATNPARRLICVYTYDWTDVADVRRVRSQLRDFGFVAKIQYKADDDTRAGSYSGQGKKPISKYYE